MRQTAHVMTRAAVRRLGAQADAAAGAAGGGGGGQAGARRTRKALFTQRQGQHRRDAVRRVPHAGGRGHDGTTGPDLDQVLKGKDAAFIKQSIVHPDAEIAKGFGKGIMPPNYGSTLSGAEVDALVKFLSEATK